ncbi:MULTISPECIES: HepT-like ribonuclease domain-containing protein [Bacteroides]|jgi:uncharacterized protein with HEPN domain|uniref:HepT-like ribonuclease domain-containing protein n=1 Tax=Bacteroides TaxID=816 RepID=UPI000E522FAF|nr:MULTISPECIES: DUF86 domain-containing protein [Bacteroides]RGU21637.1 DUF86 domain-containing protein [Bacteroides cellulosilyticus]
MEYTSSNRRIIALNILKQIEEAIVKIQERTSVIHHADDFLLTSGGMEKLDAACMLLIAIGESLKNLDKVTEKKLLPTNTSIPWNDVMGVRDIIAHHYFNIDADEIWWIISKELTPLLEAIRSFIRDLSEEPYSI